MARPAAELNCDEFNDLNERLASALRRAHEFGALWSVWSDHGNVVAALSAGIAAAACRALVSQIHTAWFVIHRSTRLIAEIDEPFASTASVASPHHGETKEKALDRLVEEIAERDPETLAPLIETLPRRGIRSVRERLRQLRACPEWSDPTGILHDHSSEGCAALFRTLLVSPVVHLGVRDDLVHIVALRREARKFRDKVHSFDRAVGVKNEQPKDTRALWLPNLYEKGEPFREYLDELCAGDVRTRHNNREAQRVAIIRAIAEHFQCYWGMSRKVATQTFRTEPWSTGIAALAHASLNRLVTTEDVRGALKNWSSD